MQRLTAINHVQSLHTRRATSADHMPSHIGIIAARCSTRMPLLLLARLQEIPYCHHRIWLRPDSP